MAAETTDEGKIAPEVEQERDQEQTDTREPYEPPHITVLGTFDELTKVKGQTSTDHAGHASV